MKGVAVVLAEYWGAKIGRYRCRCCFSTRERHTQSEGYLLWKLTEQPRLLAAAALSKALGTTMTTVLENRYVE